MSEKHRNAITAGMRARVTRLITHLRTSLDGRYGEPLYRYPLGPHPIHSPNLTWRLELPEDRDTAVLSWNLGGEKIFPMDLPLKFVVLKRTIGEALAFIDQHREELTAWAADQIYTLLPLVPSKLRAATIARESLYQQWPWISLPSIAELVDTLEALRALAPSQPGELPSTAGTPNEWPPQVAVNDVIAWVRMVMQTSPQNPAVLWYAGRYESFRLYCEQLRTEKNIDVPQVAWESYPGADEIYFPALGVLYAAYQEVERDRRRVAIAIDAGIHNHHLLTGLRDLPKNNQPHDVTTTADGRIELLGPGLSVQLTLNLDPDSNTPSEALVRAIRDTRGWPALRAWTALQRLFSVEGGRQGWVRWTVDGHMDALGISKKNRTKADVREKVARQVEAFTKLELAVYDTHGRERERRPLILVGAKYDRLEGSAWHLDGMQLTINPLLYSGVRQASGRLGANWHPAPVALAQVNEASHPHTYALGNILPIRWRLALAEGKDHITLKGDSALAVAGIKYHPRKPADAWRRLERDLNELQRIEGLGQWEWEPADPPRTLESRLHLWPAPWALDRTVHEVRPVELPPTEAALTGAELKAWRTRRALTQHAAAARLGVSRYTVIRAEGKPEDPLTRELAQKVREAGI